MSIACTQSEHLKARPAGGTVRRRRIGASGLSLKDSVFLTPFGQLHPGRANKRKAPLNFSFPLEGKCHEVAKGCTRLRITMLLHCCSTQGQLRLTWKPSAGSPQSEGSRFKTIVNQLSLNTGRQEGDVAGGSPLVPDGITFPYIWENNRAQQCKKPYINRFPIDIRLLFMEPATGFEPATYALRMRRSTS